MAMAEDFHQGQIGKYRPWSLVEDSKIEPSLVEEIDAQLKTLGYQAVGEFRVSVDKEKYLFRGRSGQSFPGDFRGYAGPLGHAIFGESDTIYKHGDDNPGHRFLEFYTVLTNGSSVTTSTNPILVPPHAAGHRESHPDLEPTALFQRHQQRVERWGQAQPAEATLTAIAESIEDFLVRTHQIDHGYVTPVPGPWGDLFEDLQEVAADCQKPDVFVQLRPRFDDLKKTLYQAAASPDRDQLLGYCGLLEMFIEFTGGNLAEALQLYCEIPHKPGVGWQSGIHFRDDLLPAVLANAQIEVRPTALLSPRSEWDSSVIPTLGARVEQAILTRSGLCWDVPRERDGEVWVTTLRLASTGGQITLTPLCELPQKEKNEAQELLRKKSPEASGALARLAARCLDHQMPEIAFWCCLKVLAFKPQHPMATAAIKALQGQGINLDEGQLQAIEEMVNLRPWERELYPSSHYLRSLEETRIAGEVNRPEVTRSMNPDLQRVLASDEEDGVIVKGELGDLSLMLMVEEALCRVGRSNFLDLLERISEDEQDSDERVGVIGELIDGLEDEEYSQADLEAVVELQDLQGMEYYDPGWSGEDDGWRVESFDGVENFPNLEKIAIEEHAYPSLEPLTSLTKLHTLHLVANTSEPEEFEDAEVLEELPNLQTIELG